jgi:hypothetical protein
MKSVLSLLFIPCAVCFKFWPTKIISSTVNIDVSNTKRPVRQSTHLHVSNTKLDETVQIGAGAKASLNCEVDYRGKINFCLRSSDNGFSGPSRYKVMNEITNDLFRVIMIGYEPAVDLIVVGFDGYKNQLTTTGTIQTETDTGTIMGGDSKDPNLDSALLYLSWMEALLINGVIQDFYPLGPAPAEGDSDYIKGYKRLLDLLKDAGCKFSPSGTIRPRPENSNICLSVLDYNRPLGISRASKTLELNQLSNCVSKAMLYGFTKDKNFLAYSFESLVTDFSRRWKLSQDSQEVLYLKALALLLRSGLTTASEAITYTFPLRNLGNGSDVDITPMNLEMAIPPLRLHDTYQNAFQKVIEACISEIGSRGGSVPQNGNDEEILLTFVLWEQSLRRNLTG